MNLKQITKKKMNQSRKSKRIVIFSPNLKRVIAASLVRNCVYHKFAEAEYSRAFALAANAWRISGAGMTILMIVYRCKAVFWTFMQ